MRLLLAITADSFRIKYRIVMKAFLDYDNSMLSVFRSADEHRSSSIDPGGFG